ncbi:MAG TPA: hypothetical protein VLM40_12665, partial [Gemmata sp.]|nr:hypothetical protein [Gemmata sp.]
MQPAAPTNLDDPALYLNRDLSWLEFNRRVLEEAQDPSVPMLERLKFLAIFSSNLDEFFMVRVGNMQQKVQARIPTGSGADQMSPAAQLEKVRQTVKELVGEQYRVLGEEVLPALQERGIVIRGASDLSDDERKHVRDLFRREIFPILTPLATDPAHPFPHLLNRSLNLVVSLRRPGEADSLYAVVQVPGVMPRFVVLPAGGSREPVTAIRESGIRTLEATLRRVELPGMNGLPLGDPVHDSRPGVPLYSFIPLEEVIRLHLAELFPGMELGRCTAFRLTRDSEYELDDEVDDLLEEIEAHVKARRRGHPVRLEIEADAPADIVQFLTEGLHLNAADAYKISGLLDLTGLFEVLRVDGFADLRDPAFVPAPVPAFAQAT